MMCSADPDCYHTVSQSERLEQCRLIGLHFMIIHRFRTRCAARPRTDHPYSLPASLLLFLMSSADALTHRPAYIAHGEISVSTTNNCICDIALLG
ncbi:hypothetical protein PDJAM_G00098370, partial [Pangasius djambal]|nr:hypothetical protein [Pangasius djambal]